MKIDQIIILDDDARGNVLAFIKDEGLTLLKEEFQVEKAVAVIGNKEMSELQLYQGRDNIGSFNKPTATAFPKDTAIGILKTIQAKGKNILILCDREWVVDKHGEALEEAFKKIVSAFDDVQSETGERDGKRYEKIIMVFYTTIYEQDSPSIPNQRGDVIIKQKAILDWDWGDPYSSVCRLKNFLVESGTCEITDSREEGL